MVVLQRPHELDLAERWLGRRPGRDVPALFLEHNTPKGDVPNSRHPVADQPGLTIVHVTHFNRLFWDTGGSPTRVVEHGIVDPGHRFTGELPHVAVAVNEPVRRGRVTGTDLIGRFATAAPVDAFGIGAAALSAHTGLPADRLGTFDDVSQRTMHAEFARRRVYAHLPRWTSLGLSLLEAMHLGMPVVALATTEAYEAVPPGAGVLSTDRACSSTRHAASWPIPTSPARTARRPARPLSTVTACTGSCATGTTCSPRRPPEPFISPDLIAHWVLGPRHTHRRCPRTDGSIPAPSR